MLLAASAARGSHIYGGFLSLGEVDRTRSLFRLEMSLFVDAVNTLPSEDQYLRGAYFPLRLYEKRTNRLIEEVTVYASSANELIYDNAACAEKYNFRTRVYRFSAEVTLDPARYSSAEGYYATWERCCRPAGISNLVKAGTNGLVLYLEFPSMKESGTAFSTPRFLLPDGNYLCARKQAQIRFTAVDKDGDELRYSLVTPWRGHSDEVNFDAPPKPAPYAEAVWEQGFSAAGCIPGSVSLNAATGELSVTPSALGLFAFAIRCEKVRNGKVISVVRQEFQLPVIDCSQERPAPPVILANGAAVSAASICGSQSLTLNVEETGRYHYQWKKNGVNLPGETSQSLTVSDTGNYTILKSYADRCAGDTLSRAVVISLPQLIFPQKGQKVCAADTFQLRVMPLGSYHIRWYRGTVEVGNGPLLTAYGAGVYRVTAESSVAGCPALSDSTEVVQETPPAVPGDFQVRYTLCPGDSVRIGLSAQPGYSYKWDYQSKSGPAVTVSRAGNYRLTITDNRSGCRTAAPSIAVEEIATGRLVFSPIPATCAAKGNTILLEAMPTGGVFSGTGVAGALFDPVVAGVGKHVVRYYLVSGSCVISATDTVVVQPPFELKVPSSVMAFGGEPVVIEAKASVPVSCVWSPATGLSNAQSLRTTVTPTGTITYRIRAVAADGCAAEDSVTVAVSRQLLIPNAFTPNRDGQNDTWEIANAELVSGCEVEIFNRWGDRIYRQTGPYRPWNGIMENGQTVPAGVYAYRITPDDGTGFSYRGSLTIMY